jgi:hypothetical protein
MFTCNLLKVKVISLKDKRFLSSREKQQQTSNNMSKERASETKPQKKKTPP